MPELPEVEAVTQTVRPLVLARKIRFVQVFHPIATKPQSPASLVRSVQNQTVRAVTRRGKYLLLELERGILSIHFRLDGRLVWFASDSLAKEFARLHKAIVSVLRRALECCLHPAPDSQNRKRQRNERTA